MDITTLSKSELIELLYAVTEKAKKKSGKDDDLSTYFTNRTSYKPFKMERGGPDKRSRNLSRNRGAKTPRILFEDESHDRIAREADVRRRRGIPTMTGVRGKELLDAVTEKGKKKGRGGGDGGPKATGNEPRPSKTFTREAMNRPEGPGNKYSAPQGPDKKSRNMKKSWQWESPMGKMRGKELFESTEKAKRKSVLPPKDEAGGRSVQEINRKKLDKESNASGQHPDYKPDFSKGQRPLLKIASQLASRAPQLPSAGRTTPRVMPGSRVDINKQNRDAAANRKKATLNKRSDFHAMKVNEAKTKRRKELQTEQAIDQYLSYESEMDDNRQLMFEVITEKAKNRDAKDENPRRFEPQAREKIYRTADAMMGKATADYKKAGGKGENLENRSFSERGGIFPNLRGKDVSRAERDYGRAKNMKAKFATPKSASVPPVNRKAVAQRSQASAQSHNQNESKQGRDAASSNRNVSAQLAKSQGAAQKHNRLESKQTDQGQKKNQNMLRAIASSSQSASQKLNQNERKQSTPRFQGVRDRAVAQRSQAAAQKFNKNENKQASQEQARAQRAARQSSANKELQFEATEKGIRPPPRIAPPPRLTASQEAKKRSNASNNVNKGERWKPKDERNAVTYSKYGGWSEHVNPKGQQLTQDRKRSEAKAGKARLIQEGAYGPNAGSGQQKSPYSPENVGDKRRGAQAQKIQAATRMQVKVGQARQKRKLGFPAIVPRRRNKEQQFDGSLVVGAESFFLQMVAATKPK